MIWLLLILTLPTENATARMRAWRALKASGAAVLRDGVYLLPESPDRRALLAAIADEVEASGGMAYLLDVVADSLFAELFDRTEEYHRLVAEVAACQGSLGTAGPQDVAKQCRKLRKAFVGITAIDFFPGEARRQVEAELTALEQHLKAAQSAHEPSPRPGEVQRRTPAAYRGRVWATRKRPWVDRLASAWLIRRHIDREARFLWLDSPADCPADALGFDFDGAAFSHVGERVTFETLLASFGLDADQALRRLGRIVHFLDVGGLPATEAAGIESVLAGLRSAEPNDDVLLEKASNVFDWLMQSYTEKDHD